MGFWSTVLVALRLRSGALPVSTAPLHLYRVRLAAVTAPRLRVNAESTSRVRNNFDSVQRVRVEAR